MTLPQRMFKDPADVLQDKQAETCKGCVHARNQAWDQGYAEPIPRCTNPATAQLLADKRCDHYEDA